MIKITQNPFFRNYLPSILIITVVAIFYFVCIHFSYNFFYQDDYHLLRFVTVIEDNSVSLQEKFNALWGLHNEHRIIFPRLITLLDYIIQGHIDWGVLNVVSALYYLGIFYFFYKIIIKNSFNNWYVLPVALLIFQPSAYENFFWTISILQQVGNVFWAMFLFYSIVYFKPSKFWISLLLVFILTFTHGNGLFAFAVGGLLLILQKRYKELLIWIGFMIVITFLYFYHYYTAQNSNIAGSLSNLSRLIGCFGGFWGVCFKEIFDSTNYAILVGLVLFSILFLINLRVIFTALFSKYNPKFEKFFPQKNLFLLACFLYFTITSGLVALSRSWSSIDAAFQNRYLHNSVIALVLLYTTLLLYKSNFIRKIILSLGLILGLSYYIFAWYQNYEFLVFQHQNQESDAVNYALNGVTTVNDKFFNDDIKEVLSNSFKKNISIMPFTSLKNTIQNIEKYTVKSKVDYLITLGKDSILTFNITNSHYRPVYHFTNVDFPASNRIYLTLKSTQNTFVFATNHRKIRKVDFLKSGQFFTNGFYVSIITNAIPSGEYAVGILQKSDDNSFHFYPTTSKIFAK